MTFDVKNYNIYLGIIYWRKKCLDYLRDIDIFLQIVNKKTLKMSRAKTNCTKSNGHLSFQWQTLNKK